MVQAMRQKVARLMARIRTLKPECWQDEAFGTVSIEAECLFVGLITQADDYGRLEASALRMRALIWPYKPDLDATRVEAWLTELEGARLIVRYEPDGRPCIALCGWGGNQKVDRPTPSKIPDPPTLASPRESSRKIALDQGSRIKDQGSLNVDSLRSSPRCDNHDGHDAGEAAPDEAPLCHLLADLIVQNGGRRPRIGKKWTTAERLLLDRDERDRSEAERLIRWCQDDEFWRPNIMSMAKFREKYDQLRLKAKRTTTGRRERQEHDAQVLQALIVGGPA